MYNPENGWQANRKKNGGCGRTAALLVILLVILGVIVGGCVYPVRTESADELICQQLKANVNDAWWEWVLVCNDAQHDVTCYLYMNKGISCLPNQELRHQ